MYQIDIPSAASTQPGSTSSGTAGYFTDGNPATGIAATIVPAEFLNAIMMELLNTITAAGITPNKAQFSQLAASIKALSQAGVAVFGTDTGNANVYVVAYTPAIGSLVDGMVLKFKAKTANTGASTFNPNGTGAKPIVGLAHAALQGGEIAANGDVWVQWNSSVGAGSWVLVASSGGAIQCAPAVQSQQAVAMGQLYGGLKGLQKFTSSGSFTVPNGVTTIYVSGCAGGGGGGGGGGGQGGFFGSGGGGGGAGQSSVRTAYTVTPGQVISITIGAAGTAGTTSTSAGGTGGSGGNTVIGSLVTLTGGSGGAGGANGSTVGAVAGGGGGSGQPAGAWGGDGSSGAGTACGGTGASSPFGGGGGGGRAGTTSVPSGVSAPMSTNGGGGGGGGGFYGGGSTATAGGAGGAGSPGLAIIEW